MKIITGFVCALVVLSGLSFATSSCAKKTTTPTPAPVSTTPSYTFNAMGVTATGVAYTVSNPTTGPMQIKAVNGGGDQTITITVSSTINSMGTYTLATQYNNSGVYTSGSNTFRYTTNSSPYIGTLTVSKIDMTNKIMSASFSFNAQQYFPNPSNSGTVYGSFDNIGF
jgi:hypothetical protein